MSPTQTSPAAAGIQIAHLRRVIAALSEYQDAVESAHVADRAHHRAVCARDLAETPRTTQALYAAEARQAARGSGALLAATDLLRLLLATQGLDLDVLVDAHRRGDVAEALESSVRLTAKAAE